MFYKFFLFHIFDILFFSFVPKVAKQMLKFLDDVDSLKYEDIAALVVSRTNMTLMEKVTQSFDEILHFPVSMSKCSNGFS